MVISLRIVKTASVLVCLAEHRLSRVPPGLPRPRDRATPPPHGSPRCHRQKNGRRHPIRRAGGVGRRPPGDGSVLVNGADPREGRGFQHFRRRFPPGDFFRLPCLGFHLYGRRFFPGMVYCYPPRDFFVSPVFWLSGRALDSVRRSPLFEPHVSSFPSLL